MAAISRYDVNRYNFVNIYHILRILVCNIMFLSYRNTNHLSFSNLPLTSIIRNAVIMSLEHVV